MRLRKRSILINYIVTLGTMVIIPLFETQLFSEIFHIDSLGLVLSVFFKIIVDGCVYLS